MKQFGGMRFTLLIAFASLILVGGGWYWVASLQDERALEIIRKVRERYATCRTYRDHISITSSEGSLEANLAFNRPATFLFRAVEKGVGDVKDKDIVYKATSQRGIRAFGGLDTPVEHRETWVVDVLSEFRGKPTYVRAMSIEHLSPDPYQLFVLLLPDDFGMRDLGYVRKVRLIGTEAVRGRRCFVLDSRPDGETYWIDSQTYGLVKMVDSAGTFARTMTCNPEFDTKIAPMELEFNPPSNIVPTTDYTTE